MKLNTKRTILIGFAFLAICSFWQMYDTLVPLILTRTFGMSETVSSVFMAADNVLALFLLPLFGSLSDRCHSRLGRRKPFILFGTIASVLLMLGLPLIADSYHAAPSNLKLGCFVAVLAILLVSMGTYRSPAVALMPDVTPKPLRSKANAVINLMGAIGGVLYLLVTTFLYSTKSETYKSYFPLFATVAGIMVTALLILMLFVDEPKLAAEQRRYEQAHPEEELAKETDKGEVLPKPVKKSLAFLLISIALWFIGYNSVTTWFSLYAATMWDMPEGKSAMCLTIATAGAILSYIPVGSVASRIGRRKTILFGTVLLSASFLAAFLYTVTVGVFSPALYILFVLIGIAWAAINVNSLPMVVEMCSGSEVGKFTGLYYTFSMSAQIAAPILSSLLLRYVDYRALFPFAAVFVAGSCATMLSVRHGDNRVEAKKGLEAFDVDD